MNERIAFEFDSEVLAALGPLLAAGAAEAPPARGDWQTRRAATDLLCTTLAAGLPAAEGVDVSHASTTALDGASIALRVYRPTATVTRGAVLYLHGGGMFCCSVDTHDPVVRRYAADSGVVFVAVDYRFAPEHPYPAAVEDSYAALTWLAGQASELGVDPARLVVAGDSAGGGMAAAVSLMACDRDEVQLAGQILLYPMLDDRTTELDPRLDGLALWTADDNATGWGALLGDRAGGADVPAYAAPARAVDVSGLPAAYVEVCELDILRDEGLDYAARLVKAGVSVELHLHRGAPHAFEMLAPFSRVALRAHADRLRAITSLTAATGTTGA